MKRSRYTVFGNKSHTASQTFPRPTPTMKSAQPLHAKQEAAGDRAARQGAAANASGAKPRRQHDDSDDSTGSDLSISAWKHRGDADTAAPTETAPVAAQPASACACAVPVTAIVPAWPKTAAVTYPPCRLLPPGTVCIREACGRLAIGTAVEKHVAKKQHQCDWRFCCYLCEGKAEHADHESAGINEKRWRNEMHYDGCLGLPQRAGVPETPGRALTLPRAAAVVPPQQLAPPGSEAEVVPPQQRSPPRLPTTIRTTAGVHTVGTPGLELLRTRWLAARSACTCGGMDQSSSSRW